MTAKAPSRFAHATFAGVVVVAMTRAPKALAIWMPMDDRPPPAPCTRTVSPRRRRAFVTSMRYAVRAVSGYAAAMRSGKEPGTRTKFRAGATTYSARPPFVSLPRIPNSLQRDSSPRRQVAHRPHDRVGSSTPRAPRGRRMPRPTASTVPTTSDPPTWGIGMSDGSIRTQTSRWFKADAITFMRSCPGPGSGVGSSPSSRTSGPPKERKNTARIRAENAGRGLCLPTRGLRPAETVPPRDAPVHRARRHDAGHARDDALEEPDAVASARPRGSDRFQDHAGHLVGCRRRLDFRFRKNLVVVGAVGARLRQVGRVGTERLLEPCLDGARFHEDHADAGLSRLDAQGVAEGLQGELRRAVRADERHAHSTREGTDVHDAAKSLSAHDGKDLAAHLHRTEDIHLELLAQEVPGQVLDRTELGEARIVHKRVDAFRVLHHVPHARTHGQLVDQVEPHDAERQAQSLLEERRFCFRRSDRREDSVSALGQEQGRRASDAARASGHERDRRGGRRHGTTDGLRG